MLRQQIRNYYGDPLGTGTFGSDSNYAKEASSAAAAGARWLSGACACGQGREGHRARRRRHDARDLELRDLQQLGLQPDHERDVRHRPAVPGGPGDGADGQRRCGRGLRGLLPHRAAQTQEDATLGNLTGDGVGVDAGYPEPTTLSNGEDGLFTKPAVADYPDYLKTACADEIAAGKSCTTVHYKSATRAHIESLGYDIVANFGDQFSDLEGGHADRTFKLPNPNYFLP